MDKFERIIGFFICVILAVLMYLAMDYALEKERVIECANLRVEAWAYPDFYFTQSEKDMCGL